MFGGRIVRINRTDAMASGNGNRGGFENRESQIRTPTNEMESEIADVQINGKIAEGRNEMGSVEGINGEIGDEGQLGD